MLKHAYLPAPACTLCSNMPACLHPHVRHAQTCLPACTCMYAAMLKHACLPAPACTLGYAVELGCRCPTPPSDLACPLPCPAVCLLPSPGLPPPLSCRVPAPLTWPAPSLVLVIFSVRAGGYLASYWSILWAYTLGDELPELTATKWVGGRGEGQRSYCSCYSEPPTGPILTDSEPMGGGPGGLP